MNYEQLQTEKYESFESTSEQYVKGQARAMEYFFRNHLRNACILDCGCGDGIGLKWLKENGFGNIHGLELNPRKAEKARQITSDVVIGDMHGLRRYQEESFDVIYSSHSLEHAHHPLSVLRQMYSRIEMSGWLFLVLPFPDAGPADAHCGKIDLKTYEQEPDLLLNVLDWCGFDVKEWKLDTFREPEIWIKAVKHV